MNHSRTIAFGILGVLAFSLAAVSCEPDTPGADCTDCTTDDRIAGTYDPKPYVFNLPSWFPAPIILPDNPLTVDGVELGRHLFYDPILSVDSTLACASCHRQEKSFANDRRVNTGVLGLPGKRNAMALINLAYNPRGFFWDGRAASPEEIAFVTIEDHLENNDSWDNVERKLRKHKSYPQLFRKAFGIERTSEITRDLASKAMGQFVRTLVSAQARYDRVLWARQGFPTDSEQRGISLFFIEDDQTVDHPGCSHCHFNPFFSDHNFRNNGLDSAATLDQFSDLGRGAISKNQYDNGRFKVPSLRNVELTAPYMHDGRFKTLEEVLNHYSSGGHPAANVDPNIRKFPLSTQDKADLIAFLKMLTDTAFVNNPAFGKPL